MTRMKAFGVAAEGAERVNNRSFDCALARLANNASRKILGERSAQDDIQEEYDTAPSTALRAGFEVVL